MGKFLYFDLRRFILQMSAPSNPDRQPTVSMTLSEACVLLQLCAASQERGAIRMEESEYIVRVWKKLQYAIDEVRKSALAATNQAQPPVGVPQTAPQSRAPVSALRTPRAINGVEETN